MEGIKPIHDQIGKTKGVEDTSDFKFNQEPSFDIPKNKPEAEKVVSWEAKRTQKEQEKGINPFGQKFKEIERFVNQIFVPEISKIQAQISAVEATLKSLENSAKFDTSLAGLVEGYKIAFDHLLEEKKKLQDIVRFYDEEKKHLVAQADEYQNQEKLAA